MHTKQKRKGNLFGKRADRSEREEQERTLEKNRRKAFWGLQLKYTLIPILWLYGIVFGIVTGLFLYNWFAEVAEAECEISFLEQLNALPLALAFFVLVIGVQVILIIGFARQEKNELAMRHVPLPQETKDLIRLEYSFAVTLSAFLVYFLILCLLLFAENVLSPETAYGGAELYPAFYHFMHMYRVYPIASGWAVPVLVTCIVAISLIAPIVKEDPEETVRTKGIWGVLIITFFVSYCFVERKSPTADFIVLLLFGIIYIGKFIFAYRRRQKDEGAEVTERME